jgi:hypothetical protein
MLTDIRTTGDAVNLVRRIAKKFNLDSSIIHWQDSDDTLAGLPLFSLFKLNLV